MSINRVQKLLFSEYCDFEDMVLIESPFAQTTRAGNGIRQVSLGLTPSKLVLATDILQPVEKISHNYIPGIDPDIETFELIAIYPVECINLSVFHRRKRQVLKAQLCNNRKLYFELGGFENRKAYWNLWCEKVKFLCPENSSSSRSEPSVTSSTTPSTLYISESREITKSNGLKQVWCKLNSRSQQDITKTRNKWTDKYLYLGTDFQETYNAYKPIVHSPSLNDLKKPSSSPTLIFPTIDIKNETYRCESNLSHINRFQAGVMENCNTGLLLSGDEYYISKQFSLSERESSILINPTKSSMVSTDLIKILMEESVKLWESQIKNEGRSRHKRRYGLTPQPLFLYGLGPWCATPGGKYSIRIKRAASEVSVKRSPVEPEFRFHVNKRQLVDTISCDNLKLQMDNTLALHNSIPSSKKQVIFFWTPDYWYRPMSAKDVYMQLQNHLKKIRETTTNKKTKTKIRFFRRKQEPSTDSELEKSMSPSKNKNKSVFRVFGRQNISTQRKESTGIELLKQMLHIERKLSAWDFDSVTLAEQLTMIDKELFLKVTPLELKILSHQQNSKSTPNISAIIAFSHRISCLVTTEILNNETEKTRARLISRFITTAYKCHKMINFQSCRTVLFGLQSPAIYRLRDTWAYVRKKHSTKYRIFEFLSRLYRDPRLPLYQKVLHISIQNAPVLPYIGDLITKLLGKIPQYNVNDSFNCSYNFKQKQPYIMSPLIKSIKLLHIEKDTEKKSLYQYYNPINDYEYREQCLQETIKILYHSQVNAGRYCFKLNETALEYLLKIRYREEKENFYISLSSIEPL